MHGRRTTPGDADLERFEKVCRAHGLPLTVQRRLIYEAVQNHPDHPTADDVYCAVRDRLPGVSRATVYRTLESFVRLGLLGKSAHHGSARRYDKNTTRHHHLMCVCCERTVDLDQPSLDRLRLPDVRRTGFQILDYSVHFTGVCSACRAAGKRPPSEAVAGVSPRSRKRSHGKR